MHADWDSNIRWCGQLKLSTGGYEPCVLRGVHLCRIVLAFAFCFRFQLGQIIIRIEMELPSIFIRIHLALVRYWKLESLQDSHLVKLFYLLYMRGNEWDKLLFLSCSYISSLLDLAMWASIAQQLFYLLADVITTISSQDATFAILNSKKWLSSQF